MRQQRQKPIPDALKYLAGLQHVRYIFVYPEQKDIVLVGPGEGWKVDAKGCVVGITTGRPVMLLDDLLVALRTARAAANGGITCSIDPTKEGLARMNQQLPGLSRTGDPQTMAGGLENALGMQRISVAGRAPVEPFRPRVGGGRLSHETHCHELRSFAGSRTAELLGNGQAERPHVLSPRFWLEPKYEALLRDGDGLAFELRGSGVKAMTEEDFIAASGKRAAQQKAGPAPKSGPTS